MAFQPLNRHVEVEPVETSSIIQSKDVTYEEKGKVISIAANVYIVKVGETVYFDSWLVSKYVGNDGKTRWLVPEDNIRAKETDG